MAHLWNDEPSPAQATADWHREAAVRDEEYLAMGPPDDTETTDGPWASGRTSRIDVDELHRSMAAAGLRVVAGPGPLREVIPEALDALTAGTGTPPKEQACG